MPCYVDERTSPGGTGASASTAPGFQPDAIIGLAANNTADGAANVDGMFSIGFGTYRGGSAQQAYTCMFNDDAVGTSVVCRGLHNTAFLKGLTAPTTSTVGTDYEVDLTSLDATGYTLNWADLPTTASLKHNVICIGGPNVTDALAFTFTTTASVGTQNVDISSQTGGSGWTGKPDLLLFLMQGNGHTAGDAASHAYLQMGAGGQNFLNGRSSMLAFLDAAGTMDLELRQTATVFNRFNATPAFSWSAALSAVASWPANGFQLTYTGTSTAEVVAVLALQGSFTYSIGTQTVPRSGGLPVNRDYDHGSTPELGIAWGGVMPANAATTGGDASSAVMGAWGMGAADGTRECFAGITDDDGNTTCVTGGQWSNTKSWRVYSPNSAAATLVAEADGSFSGNNFRLSFNDIDEVASADRELNILTIGNTGTDAAAATSLLWPNPPIYQNVYVR